MYKIFILILIVSLFSACAATNSTEVETLAVYEKFLADNKIQKVKKIKLFRFQGWQSLDNQHFIVNTSPQTAYLITLNRHCTDLKYATTLAFHHTRPSTLTSEFDYVLLPHSSHLKCFVSELHPLSKTQAYALEMLLK